MLFFLNKICYITFSSLLQYLRVWSPLRIQDPYSFVYPFLILVFTTAWSCNKHHICYLFRGLAVCGEAVHDDDGSGRSSCPADQTALLNTGD